METWNLLISKRKRPKRLSFNKLIMVGAEGFEPPAPVLFLEPNLFNGSLLAGCIHSDGVSASVDFESPCQKQNGQRNRVQASEAVLAADQSDKNWLWVCTRFDHFDS